jgi:hypothetical protein
MLRGMEHAPSRSNADFWVATVFSAKAVARGAVVRRSVRWVAHEIGIERFVDEVQRRGYHMVETGGQFIVICNRDPLRVIC